MKGKECVMCGHKEDLHHEAADLSYCRSREACYERQCWAMAPCCGIPEAPHPGVCDHNWERCADCQAAYPSSEMTRGILGESWYCKDCTRTGELMAECSLCGCDTDFTEE